MIQILILRNRSYSGMLSAIVIEVDGHSVAKVRRGGRVRFEIPRGEHVITARMHWMQSTPTTITADSDDNLRFLCGCSGYGESMYAWLRMSGYEFNRL